MNVFDIIGPVMVGPSSSHTAGASRIGKVARMLLGEDVSEAKISLHGSFAMTAMGHGTDKAILGGLMGYDVDDARIRDSLDLAQKAGLTYAFEKVNLGNVHPNTARLDIIGKSGKKASVVGSSIGGGNIVITQVNDVEVSIGGNYYTLVITHTDLPGVISSVTNLLACFNINIAFMRVYRSEKRGSAIMVIEADEEISDEIAALIERIPRISRATIIKPVH